jgi:thiosulfate dehydrogenase [quinone] large subunit
MSAGARARPPLPARAPGPAPTVLAGWVTLAWPLRILRAFLGLTFLYAGIQKFLDPNFLHAGTPDYIGEELTLFAQSSPVAPLLHLLGHAPVLAGVGIALLEIAVGLGTLVGIGAVTWAAVGMGIALLLFLSATWHVHPYFLGSDSIYAVAWAALLTGLIEQRARRIRAARSRAARGPRRGRGAAEAGLGRREFLRGAAVGVGALFLGVATSLLSGRPSAATARSPSTPPAKGRSTPPPVTSASPTEAKVVGSLDRIPIGGAVSFNDPAAGPAVVCRLSAERVAAYSRVCTHAGCLVDYDAQARLLVCPCHGAEFDPAQGANPLAGPAPVALPPIPVRIDRATGDVIAST